MNSPHADLLTARLTAFDELARAASGEQGAVERVLKVLANVTDGHAALLDADGMVVAGYPENASWAQDVDDESDAIERAHVTSGADLVGTLLLRAVDPDPALPRFAATVLAGELASRRSALSAQRRLAEQVLDDVLGAVIPHDVAVQRLAAFGISFDNPNQILVGRVSEPRRGSVTAVPWNLGSMLDEADRPFLRARLHDEVVVAIPAGPAAETIADELRAELVRDGGTAAIGIGGAYSGPVGLRVSYAEARTAAAAPGITVAEPLSVAEYVRIEQPDRVITEQGDYVLASLVARDSKIAGDADAKSGGLVQTLEMFLNCDCNYAHAARELHTHENTVRYRLKQIELTTGHDLSSFLTRTHFWIALANARHNARRRP